jgi:hypothetical protein
LGLDLHYLLTFYGSDANLEPQRLMGLVARKLHAQPVLARADIAAAVAAAIDGGSVHFLAASDLAAQVEMVRFTPVNFSLEEMSKLWSVFLKTDYVLSAAYVASVVLIETDEPPPGSALPVLKPVVAAVPFSPAVVEAVDPNPVELAAGATLRLALVGRNMDPGDRVTFSTPGREGTLAGAVEAGSRNERMLVAGPAGLRPGLNAVRLVRMAPVPPAPARVLFESNAVSFVLLPKVISLNPAAAQPGRITGVLSLQAGPTQRVSLVLSRVGAAGAFMLPSAPHAAETDTFTFDRTFNGGSVPAGTYLARVRVDDAETRLDVNPAGQFTGPLVNLP